MRDITERKPVEETPRQSEERFRIALQNSSIVVFNQDRDLRYTWMFNPNPPSLADLALGHTDAELFSPEEAVLLTRMKRRVLDTGESAREEVLVTINGEVFCYDLAVEPSYDSAGGLVTLLVRQWSTALSRYSPLRPRMAHGTNRDMDERFTLKIGDHLTTADKKRYYNEQVFTEIAPRYDFITRALSFWRDASWKREMVAQLPPRDAPLCLDLACGTGDIAFLLAKKYPAGRIMGIDITERMLMLARLRNAWPNVGFFNQDMGCLSADSSSIDIVTGGYALRNAPDLERALLEINRVLRPGGTAAFLDFSRPAARAPERLQHWILKAWTGFWGVALHRNHEVYSYIAESLRRYPDRMQLRRMFEDRGFMVVHTRPHFFGITELLIVRKNAEHGRIFPCHETRI